MTANKAIMKQPILSSVLKTKNHSYTTLKSILLHSSSSFFVVAAAALGANV
jgi:hypothetical protein